MLLIRILLCSHQNEGLLENSLVKTLVYNIIITFWNFNRIVIFNDNFVEVTAESVERVEVEAENAIEIETEEIETGTESEEAEVKTRNEGKDLLNDCGH